MLRCYYTKQKHSSKIQLAFLVSMFDLDNRQSFIIQLQKVSYSGSVFRCINESSGLDKLRVVNGY